MGDAIGDIPKKKRGRKPIGGRGEGVLLRLHEPVLSALDVAAASEGVGRAELARRVVVEWLTRGGFLKQ